MLSAVLRSDVAIQISIMNMNAFVQMRMFMTGNSLMFEKSIRVKFPEYRKLYCNRAGEKRIWLSYAHIRGDT